MGVVAAVELGVINTELAKHREILRLEGEEMQALDLLPWFCN